MSLSKDDIRAAVSGGTITEAQAASILALSDARRGVREKMTGQDEPFELFKGFNEIFIVVGLSILYAGWAGLTGISLFGSSNLSLTVGIMAMVAMVGIAGMARYFTLTRRMVAPSIALSIMFGLSAITVGSVLVTTMYSDSQVVWLFAGGFSTLALLAYWVLFHVPFTVFQIALSVFGTAFAATTLTGASLDNPMDLFLLSADGPFAVLTVVLGLIGLAIALRFDMSDPHRVTRRSKSGFWLHVIAAPAIVNTIALTLFQQGTVGAQLILLLFLMGLALFAVVIDRRSFLISGVGYVVALAVTVIEGQGFYAIFVLGGGLVLLGAQWENLRRVLMNTLPMFPGKTRLPPWDLLKETA
jgi:hypothetical protein